MKNSEYFPDTAEQGASNEEQLYSITQHKDIIEGLPIAFTVIKSSNTGATYRYDEDFLNKGIATEPGSTLINQSETTKLLGHPAGKKPEEYINELDNVLAVGGNHFGWQKGSFLIKEGELLLLESDKNNLTGTFSTLCMNTSGAWSCQEINMAQGESKNTTSEYKLGMNGSQIVRDGKSVPLATLLDDPRINADMRVLVDFSAGQQVTPEFFQDIRSFSPEAKGGELNPRAFQRLLLGKRAVFRASIPSTTEDRAAYERLKKSTEYIDGLAVDTDKKNESYRLGITKPLPEQRVPLTGFGCDDEGSLMIVAVDGRQEDSAGVSIRQLADLMVSVGIRDGILGCGGGDVSVVEKRNGETRILNSPSNRDNETRRVPNVIVIPLDR